MLSRTTTRRASGRWIGRLGKADDLRQLALVYDWCQPILSPQQSAALAAKIRQLAQKRTGDSIAARRDRVLALIATADDPKHPEEAPLRDLVRQWWRAGFAQALADGRSVPPLPDLYALLEMLHAIRDNLKIDLRDNAVGLLRALADISDRRPIIPAPYRAPENEFRIPVYQGDGQPDLNQAALARAAGLSMVAYDTNGLRKPVSARLADPGPFPDDDAVRRALRVPVGQSLSARTELLSASAGVS